ncbi:phosphopantothenoylcysteine decarboxylase [Limisphaera ngatamarikiensis]|uniref:Phosphopantothenoylcysteine decarboxylase n=1 Tax=Limisphaera ngatamarikiensis TaxID=1324935 RepID=A0A6M1RR19_9BACT|nr:flavoprotein [Limisphaera ngatamarikiensis]NGO39827.1 phosphopantothenoylcysteine decarboxylase [Limisphaera ngatamarikiensis]
MGNIILGVTGSIAAHRAVDLCSLLVRAGCEVRVVLTADARRFVTEVPFQTLSRHAVVTDLYDTVEGWQPTHIQWADWAELLLIAPATAHTLARLAHGLADDALTCMALALRPETPVIVAPAMNGKMWLHPATQANVEVLRRRGVEFIGPDTGLLACGYEGIGRLWPIDQIAAHVLARLGSGSAGSGPSAPAVA